MKTNPKKFVTNSRITANWLLQFSASPGWAEDASALSNVNPINQHGSYQRLIAVSPKPAPLGSRRARATASARFGVKNTTKE